MPVLNVWNGSSWIEIPTGITDHGGLTGLADDDHSIYALLAGRTGATNDIIISTDQSGRLEGSSNAGSDLILGSDGANGGIIDIEDQLEVSSVAPTITAQYRSIETIPNDITIGANGGYQSVIVDSTMTMTGNSNIFSTANLFNFAATIKNDNGVAVNARPIIALSSNAAIQADNAVLTHLGIGTLPAYMATYSNPRYAIINGGSGTAVDVVGFFSEGSIGTGWTITNFTPIKIADPTVTGTITNLIGIELAAMTAGGTLNLSLRSAGGEMRHAGAAVFGANAAATNASVGLEVQSTTQALLLPRMTTTQRNAMTAVDGMLIYNTTTAVTEAREAGAWVNL